MYCTKCGEKIPDGSYFCPNCGNNVDSSTIQPDKPPANKPDPNVLMDKSKGNQVSNQSMRCPKCGANGCMPHYKQDISGGGYVCLQGGLGALIAGPFGLLCGFCGRSVKTSNTLVWVCPKCGNEFRSREETYKGFKQSLSFVYGMIIIESLLVGIAFGMAADGSKNLGDFFGNLFMALLENVAIIIIGIAIVYFFWIIKAIPKNYSGSTVKEFLTVEEQQQIRKEATILCVAVVCLLIMPLLFTLSA